MVVIFYGTGAELIKLLGVTQRIPRDQQLLICTAQQYAGLQKVHEQLNVQPDIYLAHGKNGQDVANMKQMASLMLKAHISFFRHYLRIRKQVKKTDAMHGTKSIVIVHGDTLTTVVGSYLGRMLRLPVAHVEAGLRSGSWKNPFPEELDRRIAAKIARFHFAPNDLAETNLRTESVKGKIYNTRFNTAKDAIEQSDKFVSKEFKRLNLPKDYCLVLLHRTELLENKADLEAILKVIRRYADTKHHVVFTLHSTTKERLGSYNFLHYLDHPYIKTIPKQPYFDFMAIVKDSACVITDGGGLQEDSYFLGIPVIVHRKRTERQEGIGVNARLSGMDIEKVESFLSSHPDKKTFKKLTDANSPSELVIDLLVQHSFIQKKS